MPARGLRPQPDHTHRERRRNGAYSRHAERDPRRWGRSPVEALVGGGTTSAVIDPVYSRGIDAVSTVSFGRVIQGGVGGSTFVVSSTGSHDTLSDLTMNAGTATGTGVAGSFTATNSSPVLFNGTTTTGAVTVSATFFNWITGPVSDGAVLPGNSGLFTGETLAAGTPALPSVVLPYTATVLEPRVLQPVTGSSIGNAVAVPTTGGGLLYGAVVALPNSYYVTSAMPIRTPTTPAWSTYRARRRTRFRRPTAPRRLAR